MRRAPDRDGGPRRGRPRLVWLVLPLAVVLLLTLMRLPVSGSGFSATTQSLTNTWTMAAAATTDTIFDVSDTPAVAADPDASALNVGVKLRPKVQGEITQIKFYKGTTNTGSHIGKVWTVDGTVLGSVTFTGETASGWQTMTLGAPVSVDAFTVYIITVYLPVAHYSTTCPYWVGYGRDRTLLSAPADGEAGQQSLFKYGAATGFPTEGFGGCNYWVDATFRTASHARAGAVVQENSGATTTNGTSVTVTLPQGTATPNQVFIIVASGSVINTPAGWTKDASAVGNAGHYIFRKSAVAGETSWALTLTGSARTAWWAGEVSGLLASPFDVGSGRATTSGTTTYATPTITPTSGTRLLIATWGRSGSNQDIDFDAITNSFVKIGQVASRVAADSGNDQHLAVAWSTVAATGSSTYSTDATSRSGSGATAVIAAYK